MSVAPTCPICETAPAAAAYRPFCSKRCADVDLGRWLNEVYVAPAEEGPSEVWSAEEASRPPIARDDVTG